MTKTRIEIDVSRYYGYGNRDAIMNRTEILFIDFAFKQQTEIRFEKSEVVGRKCSQGDERKRRQKFSETFCSFTHQAAPH